MKEEISNLPLVTRRSTKVERDVSRVITRAYTPGNTIRINKIIDRVLNLSEEKSQVVYEDVSIKFYDRHKNIENVFMDNYKVVSRYINDQKSVTSIKKLLIGAYFTMEYSIESAAIFNPSIVLHPDQEGVPEGGCRFIMSLRATGEGHISSIVFRSGIIEKDASLTFDPLSAFVGMPETHHNRFYDSHLFKMKLQNMNAWEEVSQRVLDAVPERFTYDELKLSIDALYPHLEGDYKDQAIADIYWLANSNYFKRFDPKTDLSERVIFPVSDHENGGIEDARFVKFVDDNGDVTFYATYTAYNGIHILPHLLETKDFLSFNIVTLNGKAAQNKGMALFPRKIDGKYAMLSRLDGENNYIMFSDNVHFWDDAQLIQEPTNPWEFIQIGNSGSPIETDEGWLVLTHGVGAMRQYFIGAILLDLDDPTKIIKTLDRPLLTPSEAERDGYVPNVVYSCGSLIHNGTLIIPYAMSDISTGLANVDVKELLDCMVPWN